MIWFWFPNIVGEVSRVTESPSQLSKELVLFTLCFRERINRGTKPRVRLGHKELIFVEISNTAIREEQGREPKLGVI